MKKIILFLATTLFAVSFNSCGGSDDSGDGGSGSSFTVVPSATEVSVGSTITLMAKDANNVNITPEVTFYVDDVAISGTTFTSNNSGIYVIKAKRGDVFSPGVEVSFVGNNLILFNKRVLIEDFTGTWCQFCPRVSYSIEQVNAQTNDAVVVAIHRGSSDPYNFAGASSLETQINLQGYPTAMLNRTTEWSYPENSNIAQAVNLTTGSNPFIGLAMETSLSGSTATVNTKVKFGKNFSNLKLVVYALEDNLIYNQTNSTIYYGGANPIVNFEHDHVLRAVLSSDILGEAIPGTFVAGDEFSKSFTYTIPSTVNSANVHFVAFVIDATKKALNSRSAGLNVNQTFEIE